MVKADVEIGGFDQLFNLKAGRIIQKHFKMPEQDVLTTQMLEGTDGRKMSTSWGNVINIVDEPNDMFGKIMSIRDNLISKYFLLCTNKPEAEINALEKAFEMGSNPRDAKMKLAVAIVSSYYGEKTALKARQSFVDTFQKGAVPEDVLTISLAPNAVLVDALLSNGIVKSKSDFRRLIEDGAVQNMDDGTKISDPLFVVWKDAVIKVGKRRFIKIKIES